MCQEGFLHPYVETEGPLRARTIGTTAADLTTCRFSLPYAHVMPEDRKSAGSMWNCEMSMLDVDGRGWMLGPMYDMHTGQLLVSVQHIHHVYGWAAYRGTANDCSVMQAKCTVSGMLL